MRHETWEFSYAQMKFVWRAAGSVISVIRTQAKIKY